MKHEEFIEKLIAMGWSRETVRLGIRASFRCEYCDRYLLGSIEDYHTWQVEHIIPVSKGGSEDLDNKAIACEACNLMKRVNLPEGDTRAERLRSARHLIYEKRKRKQEELDELLHLVHELEIQPTLHHRFFAELELWG